MEENDLQQGEKQIHPPDPFGGMHLTGMQFVVVDAVHLGHEELHSAGAQEREERDSKDDDG